jgi:hypothetical protein
MYIVLCQGENKNKCIQYIDDKKNTTYVFASKDTHASYLNLNL